MTENIGSIRSVAWAVALVMLAVLGILAVRTSSGEAFRSSNVIGQLVPDISGVDFNGDVFSIDDHKSKWVLVNFFASWCVPCEREHPELKAFSKKHADDAVVISVPFGDTEKDAREFFKRLGGDWPVIIDDDAQWAVAFGVLRPPESFLVGPGGAVVAKWQGEISLEGVDEVINLVGRESKN
jgi:cytochrome c biogenesis protein CcmG/thiol:disulfide interchange protein DsbE|tara:strand:+ start:9395 stop:9940 length:546 start_codon:yes stop_codon:yes gene_type:complete